MGPGPRRASWGDPEPGGRGPADPPVSTPRRAQDTDLPERSLSAGRAGAPSATIRVGAATLSAVVVAALAVVALTLTTSRVPVVNPSPTSAPSQAGDPTAPSLSPSPTGDDGRPPSTPRATTGASTGEAGAGPRSWELPPRRWDPLPAADPLSPLHVAQVTDLEALAPVSLTGCPQPGVVRTEAQWKEAVQGQWNCVHAAWVPVFESLGWETTEPPLVFYTGAGSSSECGYLAAPAFYCSTGLGTVYFGDSHFRMAQHWPLSVGEMVTHEYGHHLQNLSGVTRMKMGLDASDQLERRAELQAICWSATMTYHNRSFDFGANHYDAWMDRLTHMLPSSTHGSRESMMYWGTRGLYAETLGDCNTWLVADEEVS